MSDEAATLKGGNFLLRKTNPQDIFIPEEWNEEQKMMAEAGREFIEQELHALGVVKMAELSAEKDLPFVIEILDKAGQMGFLGVGIEEQYGGIDLDFNTGLLFNEALAAGFAFATTIGAQTSIGSLPIVYYGTPAQKQKYLPGIATGEIKTCYALTEPTAGSDANSGRTRAKLTPDGKHYLLNGQKMWITNGGFADLFIVFAKIEEDGKTDENLSAFIVEKAHGGIEVGNEEKKMGIKASSTVQLFFTDTKVPAENLLAGRGEGFKIALNILNTGRIKLASSAVGGAKMGIDQSIAYAAERKQFEQPIAQFGAIQHKLGEMAAKTFATESAVYRTGFNIDRKEAALIAGGMDKRDAKIKATREFAIECALLKVFASEAVSMVVDEALQIFGGMGYAVETGVEMGYRDARILRIFEGTNEINRMLSVAELTKRALKTKEVALVKEGKKLPGYLFRQMLPFKSSAGYATEERLVQNLKYAFLLLSGASGRKLGKKMIDEQEIVMALADIMAVAYVAESTLLRLQKVEATSAADPKKLAIMKAMTQLTIYEGLKQVRTLGHDIVMNYATGGHRRMVLRGLRLLTPRYDVNPKALRRQISTYIVAEGKYPF